MLVFGDQLNTSISALASASPASHRVLMIESAGKIAARQWHIQRIHLIVASMRRFAAELREAGFDVDYRICESFATGISEHRAAYAPDRIVATEPNSWSARDRKSTRLNSSH